VCLIKTDSTFKLLLLQQALWKATREGST